MKAIKMVLCIGFTALLLCLCACHAGNARDVDIQKVSSDMYSQQEIDDAIEVILEEFKFWQGCTMTEICYAGDEVNKRENAYYIEGGVYDADEMIVLDSSFDVDESGADMSLNPGTTYDHWSWVLVRTNGGTWKHVTHGYG